MMKYTFYYRLNVRNDTRILDFCTIDKDLKAAVGAWENFKLAQTRIRELIVFINLKREKILN